MKINYTIKKEALEKLNRQKREDERKQLERQKHLKLVYGYTTNNLDTHVKP